MLTYDEEVDLGRKVQQGDIEARNQLVENNVLFVHHIINNHYKVTNNLEYEDLLGYGRLGLVEAANRFDPERGCRFSTYSRYWIKKMINDYIYRQATIVKIPSMHIKLVHDLHQLAVKVEGIYQEREVTEEELADNLGIDVTQVMSVKGGFSNISLDDDECTINIVTESDVDNAVLIDIIKQEIDNLDSFKRDILYRYYGINCRSQTLQEISELYMLSRERIRQIKKEALDEIKALLNAVSDTQESFLD